MSYGGYEAYGNDDFGGGGGGFMEGSQGGSQNTPNKRGGGGGRGSRETQGLLPITAKQLANRVTSDDDVIRIDGQEITNVKLVGILSNVTPHSTNVNFQLDDGTGVIEGRMFLHADDADYAENEVSKLRDGIYARVVGNLRIFQERVSLSAFTVTPIEDFNEITHHFLDAIYVHCYNTKGPLQGAGGGAAAAGNSFNTPVKGENTGFNVPVGQQAWNQGSSSYLGQSGMGGGGMDYGMMDSNFSPEQKAILDVLGTCTSDRGLKIDQIFTDLRGQMTEDQLRGALNYLTSEGHVYSTIDENHFKRTA